MRDQAAVDAAESSATDASDGTIADASAVAEGALIAGAGRRSAGR